MALVKCTECEKEFSDKATACPNCGCPTEEILRANDENSNEFIDNLEDKIEQQVENIMNESKETYEQEYTYMPETPWPGRNVFAIVLKVVSSIVMLAGASIGLSAILTADDSTVAFMSVFAGIWIFAGSTIFYLSFYGLGEIISILHDIRNNQ